MGQSAHERGSPARLDGGHVPRRPRPHGATVRIVPAMSAIDLMIKDLTQILRDRKSLMFILIMPIAFTLMFGFVFGGYGAPADTRLPVVVAGDTADPAHAAFTDLVASSTVVRLVDPASAEDQALRASVRDGKVTAVVFIPAGFLRACYDGSGSRTSLRCRRRQHQWNDSQE